MAAFDALLKMESRADSAERLLRQLSVRLACPSCEVFLAANAAQALYARPKEETALGATCN
jgi:hypothetical protein